MSAKRSIHGSGASGCLSMGQSDHSSSGISPKEISPSNRLQLHGHQDVVHCRSHPWCGRSHWIFFSRTFFPVGVRSVGTGRQRWRGSPAFAVLAGGEREAAGARWQLPARVSQQLGEVRRSARERVFCGRQFQEAGRQGPLHRDRHDGSPAGGPARTRRRSNPRRGFCRALAG